MRSALNRLVGAAAAGGLVLTVIGIAAPAHADSGYFDAQLEVNTLSVLPSPGKAMTLYVMGQNATNPVFVIDPTGLAGEATLDTPAGCTTNSSGLITCTFPTVGTLDETVTLVFHTTSHAVVGDTLHVTVASSSDDTSPFSQTYDIPVGNAVDLIASPRFVQNATPAHAGDHVTMKANVSNDGSLAVSGIRLTVTSDHSLLPDQYDNCVYSALAVYRHQYVCDLPGVVLNPGDGPLAIHDESGNDLGFTISPDAAGSAGVEFTFDALAGAPALQNQPQRAHSGHTLTVSRSSAAAQSAQAAQPVDANPYDNLGEAFWDLAGIHRDVAAIGANTTAKVGDTVTINVGMIDNGPAALDALRSGGEPAFFFVFQPPANADVVSVPQSCWSIVDVGGVQYGTRGAPHGIYYRCETADFVPVGVPQTTSITMKVTGGTGVPGLVTFIDKYLNPDYTYQDDNPADDNAPVAVTVPHLAPIPPPGGRCHAFPTCT